jgi:hypothetical protein
MRVLVLCGNMNAVKECMLLVGPNVTRYEPQNMVDRHDGCVVYRIVHRLRDVDRLAGMRFDVIVEHDSYRPPIIERSEIMHRIRAMVLR